MSGKPTDVRIVPHNGEWAVKLTGGLGNKPIKITPKLQIAKETAKWVAIKNEVPLVEFDDQGLLVRTTPWKELQ